MMIFVRVAISFFLLIPTACRSESILDVDRIAGHQQEYEARYIRNRAIRSIALSCVVAFVAYQTYGFFRGNTQNETAISIMPSALTLSEVAQIREIIQNTSISQKVAPPLLMRCAKWASYLGSLVVRQGALSLSMFMLNDLYGAVKQVVTMATTVGRFAHDETAVMIFLRELSRITERDKNSLFVNERKELKNLILLEIEKILGYCDMIIARNKNRIVLQNRLIACRSEIVSIAEQFDITGAEVSLAELFSFEHSLENILVRFSVIEKII